MGSIPELSIIKGPIREFSPQKLHKIFESNLTSYKHDATALICIDNENNNYNNNKNGVTKSITYNQLNEQSNQIARAIIKESLMNYNSLDAMKNQDNDLIIAVCMKPSDNLIKILLSILKCGAAYLPLDVTFPKQRVEHILNESKPLLVIYDDDFKFDDDFFQNTPIMSVTNILEKSFEMDKTNLNDTNETLTKNNNSDLGIVLYTSGSTGIPKGVRLPHAVMLNRLQWQWENFPYSKTENFSAFKTALTFVDSISEIWSPLLNGLTLIIIPKEITKDPEILVTILDNYKIERLILVPTLLRSILMFLKLNENKNFLNNLRMWVCSGESLSMSLAKSFYDYFQDGLHKLYNFYGSTEVMGDVTYFQCENNSQLENFDKVPIGYPINNTVIYLLDSDYRPVKNGEIGEIFVAGLNLASGYVNGRDPFRFVENPLAIDSKFSRLYRTGDYGALRKGVIMYEGRTDSQIKIRGHRVDLSEIEKVILDLDYIEKGIVLCYHPGEIDQSIIAFVTLKSEFKHLSGLDIEDKLKDRLLAYTIPQVYIMENIPLLVNGKIDRQKLLKFYENSNNNEEITLSYDFNGVPDEMRTTAQILFDVIATVIGKSIRSGLSLSSNFYELGGNSLNSIYTVTLLKEKGYNIGITDFITAQNLEEILLKLNKFDENDNEKQTDNGDFSNSDIRADPLTLEDKNPVIEIITSSFYGKADLEQWLKPDILITDYADILEDIWEVLVEKDLSFVIRDKTNKIIGVALNFDARDEPPVNVNSKLSIIFDFLEYLEGPIRENCLPQGLNKILHSFMMGTSEELNAQQNIAVMHFMENEVLKLAKRKNFAGILTSNTNPLTQQLGTDVYKYKIMLDYQVNEYIHSNGTIPFALAPDSQRVIVHWKEIQ